MRSCWSSEGEGEEGEGGVVVGVEGVPGVGRGRGGGGLQDIHPFMLCFISARKGSTTGL